MYAQTVLNRLKLEVQLGEAFLVMLIAVTIGGGIGARIAAAPPWKGALVMAGASIIVAAAMIALEVESGLLTLLASLLCVAVLGSAMKLRNNQIASVLIGGVLATAAVYFAADTVRFFS